MRNSRMATILGLGAVATAAVWIATGPQNASIVSVSLMAVMCFVTMDF
jgi:hypothetical protein